MASTPACQPGAAGTRQSATPPASMPATRIGDGFCNMHVDTMEGPWSLLHSWLRTHLGLSQEKLPFHLAFFQFVHNARCRGKTLLGAFVAGLVV